MVVVTDIYERSISTISSGLRPYYFILVALHQYTFIFNSVGLVLKETLMK